MFPQRKINNPCNNWFRDTVPSCKPPISNTPSGIFIADIMRVYLFQFGTSILCALGWCKTTLCNHILHVFKVCSKPQMSRVAAWWVVARVANLNPARNTGLTISKKPRNSVCSLGSVRENPEVSISVADNASGPKPTLVGAAFVNFGPKIAKLPFGQIDLSNRTCDLSRSFIHIIGMFVVRARLVFLNLTALAFCTPFPTILQGEVSNVPA